MEIYSAFFSLFPDSKAEQKEAERERERGWEMDIGKAGKQSNGNESQQTLVALFILECWLPVQLKTSDYHYFLLVNQFNFILIS